MIATDTRRSAFLRPRPVDDPAIRLIGFHHAGGSAAVYYPLVRQLPDDWDLLLLDLPGRGRRAAEPLLDDMDAVVARTVADVLPWTDDAPVALFGHSMGAIVALETARALENLGRHPVWTGVSGRVAPLHRRAGAVPLHTLDDAALLDVMMELGGMPEGVTGATAFLERFLRTVRADLRAVDNYRPAQGRSPMRTPLTVFGGTQDAWAPAASMHQWSRESRSRFAQTFFPGGHFYFLGSGFPAFTRQLVRQIDLCRHASTPQAA
ncbi:alpha/beta fold hydrolase [Streptomyces sp. NBC_01218]|uniref:thioesterase II family protein n=1 Tax=unclassified Streptomyces TaxID=2593676 RepID=UPI0023B8DC09|nr:MULTISPECIES: alpha/beta fold hydrolase [unclassified Streptomyces]WEH39052.1 alpha/beta fold hydrolase [Streptomyces sp. AM 2-1-1]WSQ50708.1 alpha/beta fold hydrolase [Streptomyces sp. NBC_01218]